VCEWCKRIVWQAVPYVGVRRTVLFKQQIEPNLGVKSISSSYIVTYYLPVYIVDGHLGDGIRRVQATYGRGGGYRRRQLWVIYKGQCIWT
jgi:hypothetical protein